MILQQPMPYASVYHVGMLRVGVPSFKRRLNSWPVRTGLIDCQHSRGPMNQQQKVTVYGVAGLCALALLRSLSAGSFLADRGPRRSNNR